MENETQPTFADNRDRGRYQAVLEGRPVGFSEYRLEPGRIVFTHTVVRPEFEGRGIGSRLAKFAVDDAQVRGLRITPLCPFVRAYLRRHKQYHAITDFPDAGEDAADLNSR